MKKKNNLLHQLHFDNRGNMLLLVMVFGFLSFTLIVSAVSSYAIAENRASIHKHNRESAFQIAEAGVSYYRWHLAHSKTDYQDGTATSGPYIHEYQDKDGNVIGHYSLDIIAPPSGSSVVTVYSTGWLDSQPESKRVIKVRLGFPALTDYAFLSASDIWIGNTEVVHGKMHVNGGIRFDGSTDSLLASSVPTYVCKPNHGCNYVTKPGIWGAGGPTQYWSFPVPAKDFNAVTAKLADIKTGSKNGGLYLSSSGRSGWHLQFLSTGKIKVTRVWSTNCHYGEDTSGVEANRCVDIRTEDSTATYNMPTNGYIYAEDQVWVDGVVNGRATVGVADGKSIIIDNNLTYLAKDGNHTLGLIAPKDIALSYNTPDPMEIDAAMLAQTGAVQAYYFGKKYNQLLTYGSIISYGVWTWSWSSGSTVVSGYEHTNSTYDANLTYGPPPSFPVGSEYNLISWELVR